MCAKTSIAATLELLLGRLVEHRNKVTVTVKDLSSGKETTHEHATLLAGEYPDDNDHFFSAYFKTETGEKFEAFYCEPGTTPAPEHNIVIIGLRLHL